MKNLTLRSATTKISMISTTTKTTMIKKEKIAHNNSNKRMMKTFAHLQLHKIRRRLREVDNFLRTRRVNYERKEWPSYKNQLMIIRKKKHLRESFSFPTKVFRIAKSLKQKIELNVKKILKWMKIKNLIPNLELLFKYKYPTFKFSLIKSQKELFFSIMNQLLHFNKTTFIISMQLLILRYFLI